MFLAGPPPPHDPLLQGETLSFASDGARPAWMTTGSFFTIAGAEHPANDGEYVVTAARRAEVSVGLAAAAADADATGPANFTRETLRLSGSRARMRASRADSNVLEDRGARRARVDRRIAFYPPASYPINRGAWPGHEGAEGAFDVRWTGHIRFPAEGAWHLHEVPGGY